MLKHLISTCLVATALCSTIFTAHAEGPPSQGSVIGNPTLVQNQDIAKAQAVGAITSFMSKGAQECDADGKNCRSLFGGDDELDYSSVQLRSQSLTGVDSFSFLDSDDGSNSVSSQTGTLALACGDATVHKVAGIAFKATDCLVNTAGDVRLTYQVCTAPARSNPITQPDNAVVCSANPTDSNYTAPAGKVCMRPACDSEPLNSLNGWSAPQTVSWTAKLPDGSSEDVVSKNGLEMVFYPALDGSSPMSFASDSDNMTAVKVVQSFVNNETKTSAVGLRLAYRHKTLVTKEMLNGGSAAVPNPGQHTAQWDTLLKLQSNPLIPKYQAQYAADGSECLQQIQSGIESDGKITVCNPGYSNESGIRPLALEATVAMEGQDCGSTAQCIKEVVNTNTWTESCSVDVPQGLRDCTTTQDYTLDKLSYTRTRTAEFCHETRVTAEYSCRTYALPDNCQQDSVVTSGGVDMNASAPDASVVLTEMVDANTARYRMGTVGGDYWGTGYYSREFVVDIRSLEDVKKFRVYNVGFDDEMAIAINGNWAWADYAGGTYFPQYDKWGKMVKTCVSWEDMGCSGWADVFMSQWERATNWRYDTDVDLRPYLREGRNVIRVDTGVVGHGEGWIFLEISAWSVRCTTRTINDCSGYEAAR